MISIVIMLIIIIIIIISSSSSSSYIIIMIMQITCVPMPRIDRQDKTTGPSKLKPAGLTKHLYIYIEREREVSKCICMYIYIYRERERYGERPRALPYVGDPTHTPHGHGTCVSNSTKAKQQNVYIYIYIHTYIHTYVHINYRKEGKKNCAGGQHL